MSEYPGRFRMIHARVHPFTWMRISRSHRRDCQPDLNPTIFRLRLYRTNFRCPMLFKTKLIRCQDEKRMTAIHPWWSSISNPYFDSNSFYFSITCWHIGKLTSCFPPSKMDASQLEKFLIGISIDPFVSFSIYALETLYELGERAT